MRENGRLTRGERPGARLRCAGMAHIVIRCAEGRAYDVTVDGTSRHRVSAPARFGDEELERAVRVCFEFLL